MARFGCSLCLLVFLCGSCLFTTGCASAVAAGTSSALSGVDLTQMTDDMAARIAADQAVQQAYEDSGPLRVVVMPVVNRLTAEIIPPGEAEAFTARVRVLLSKYARDRFVWIMNRDAFYRLRGRELDIDLGPSPDAIDPQYALAATFRSLTDENSKRRQSYYLCTYELTKLDDRTVLWTGTYEVEKKAVKGFLD